MSTATNADGWIRYNPLTSTYDTRDGTCVAAELVDNAQCLAHVLRIYQIRAEQRSANSAKEQGNG